MAAIELSTKQTVQTGTLRYGAYKKIKQRVIQSLATKAANILRGREVSPDLVSTILNEMAGDIATVVDELNVEFVVGCTSLKEEDLNDLPVTDIQLLFDSCLEQNPLQTFMEMEKNSPAGSLIRQLMDGLSATNAQDSGTPESSVTVFDPAGESQS